MNDIEAIRDDLADVPAVPGITDPTDLLAYWYGFITTPEAAAFVNGTERGLREQRQRGDGAPYYAITPRMIRYRRIDQHRHAMQRRRRSTSDTGRNTAQ